MSFIRGERVFVGIFLDNCVEGRERESGALLFSSLIQSTRGGEREEEVRKLSWREKNGKRKK